MKHCENTAWVLHGQCGDWIWGFVNISILGAAGTSILVPWDVLEVGPELVFLLAAYERDLEADITGDVWPLPEDA